MPFIIYRYLAKEVLMALAGLTTILLLIFVSNQFVNYLTRAAAGKIPGMIVVKLLMLEIPTLVGLLLPLGLFSALLLAYGRLYAENEMVVMQACGFNQKQLLGFTLFFASIVSIVVAVIVCWLGPNISRDRDYLMTGGGYSAAAQTLIPGRFLAMSGGNTVLYVEKMTRDHETANDIFVAEQLSPDKTGQLQWRITTARSANVVEDHGTSSVHLNLEQGHVYEGQPGRRDYRVASFDRYQHRLPEVKPHIRKVESALSMSELWPLNNIDPKRVAELNWRLSIPIMTFLLALLAVPLSTVQPRQGKYTKLLPAIIIYVIYANLLFVGRDWLSDKQIPSWLGMWWLHAGVLLLALSLLYWPVWKRQRRMIR